MLLTRKELCNRLKNLEIVYEDIKKDNRSTIGKLLEFSAPELFKNKQFKNIKDIEVFNALLLNEITNYTKKNKHSCLEKHTSTSYLRRKSTLVNKKD